MTQIWPKFRQIWLLPNNGVAFLTSSFLKKINWPSFELGLTIVMVTQLHVTIIVIAFYSLFVDVEKNRKENGLKDRWKEKK